MAKFIRLASLTEQGVRNIKNLKGMLGEAKEIMKANGASLESAYMTLGRYDIIAVIDAPDAATAAKVSALIGAQGNFRAETLSAVSMEDFMSSIQS